MLRTALALAIYLTLIPNQSAEAFIYDYDGENIVKIMELPDTDKFKTSEGYYFDVGAVYKRFRIMGIPIWNYDVRWCGYVESRTQYREYITFTYDEMKQYTDAASLPLEDNIQLPFWDAWGGKLLIVVAIALAIGGAGWVRTDTRNSIVRALLIDDTDCPHCASEGVSTKVPFPLSKNSTYVLGWVPLKAWPRLRFGGALKATVVCERCDNPVTLEMGVGKWGWKEYMSLVIVVPMVLLGLYLWSTGQFPS